MAGNRRKTWIEHLKDTLVALVTGNVIFDVQSKWAGISRETFIEWFQGTVSGLDFECWVKS